MPKPTQTPNSALLVTIQWLSYTFWMFTIIAVAAISASTIPFFTDTTTASAPEFTTYAVVSALILLPIALVADIIYARMAPKKRPPASSVVMVIHTVIFSVAALGGLISVVFLSVNSLLSTSTSPILAEVVTAAIIFLLFAGLSLRISRSHPKRWLVLGFRADVIIVTLVAIGFAVAGPVGYGVITKQDRLARDAAIMLSSRISTSVNTNGTLPATIDAALEDESTYYSVFDDTIGDASKDLAKKGIITYTPNTTKPTEKYDSFSETTQKTFYYEICVTYNHALRKDVFNDYPAAIDSDGNSEYIPGDVAEPGKKCYPLKAIYYKP